MRADRHIVMGSRGTAIAASGVLALVDAPTGSPIASAWEALILGVDTPAALEDRLGSLDSEALASFAVAVGARGATWLVVRGASSVADDGRIIVRHAITDDEPWASTEVAEDDVVTLVLHGDDAPTGQWLRDGVIAAGSVVVGRLQAPRTRRAASEPVASDVDFGNLIGRPAAERGSANPASESVIEAEAEAEPEPSQPIPVPLSAEPPARTDATAQFVPGPTFDPSGRIRFSDGRVLPIDSPIVIGRRPPHDAIGDLAPHTVVHDDAMLSRYHVTLRVVDGRLVAVDEGSTNGTTVTRPGAAPTPCVPRQPTEVPLGATVDIGGVLTATYEAGGAAC
jgi:pSer/pThr/pTyr-binding forkhead associated (FHA) protein